MLNQEIIIESDLAAVQIPGGNGLILPEGSRIYITQMLGTSITAASDIGLVRISKEEAQHAGIIPPTDDAAADDSDLSLEEQIWKCLGSIYDPEIPVDIVNLGLIYNLELIELPEQGTHVNIKMTLTSPTCGMGPFLMAEAEANTAAIPGVAAVDVEFVWDPPWNQDMMSDEARMQLGYI